MSFSASLSLIITQDLSLTVGIHPTVAEEFTLMTVTRASGVDFKKSSC